ncbi:MAG TPA: hypothetical protein VHB51_03355 [Candidatus Saccharimonadales bacterium]|nr:hypothetical protein [Candidatus Saccharimonadales bacterium]
MAGPIGHDPNFVPTLENQTEMLGKMERTKIALGSAAVSFAFATGANLEFSGSKTLSLVFGTVALLAGGNALGARRHAKTAQAFLDRHSQPAETLVLGN